MKIVYSQASRDDVIRQFRYYLIQQGAPDVAIGFREAVRKTAELIRERPYSAPPYSLGNPHFRTLRAWPVKGFEAIRCYFLIDDDCVRVLRILHSKRNVQRILKREK